jgi:hypothetical protein
LHRLAAPTPVELTYALGRDLPPRRVAGVVRWIGPSLVHGCAGVGLELRG